jgi:flagellar protein FlbD
VIALTRPNGRPLYVNPDLIETAERDEDGRATTVLLTTGNVLVVSDPPDAIVEHIVALRRRIAAAPS